MPGVNLEHPPLTLRGRSSGLSFRLRKGQGALASFSHEPDPSASGGVGGFRLELKAPGSELKSAQADCAVLTLNYASSR